MSIKTSSSRYYVNIKKISELRQSNFLVITHLYIMRNLNTIMPTNLKMVHTYVNDEQYNFLKDESKRTSCSVSSILKFLISRSIEDNKT